MAKSPQNFHVEFKIDGRKAVLKGGPRAKNGGLQGSISVRRKSEVITPVQINARHECGNQLVLEIKFNGSDWKVNPASPDTIQLISQR